MKKLLLLLAIVLLLGGCVEEVEEQDVPEPEPAPLVMDLSEQELNESVETDESYVTGVRVSLITQHSARISWLTAFPTESILIYGSGGNLTNMTVKQGMRAAHTIYLIALEPNTEYSFRIGVNLSNGTIWESETYNFTTLRLPLPELINLSVVPGHSQINITWRLERPATAVVKLGTSPEAAQVVYTNSTRSATHSTVLYGVYPGKKYYLSIGGYDRYSGSFETDPMVVTTPPASLGDTLERGNLSITPLEFIKRYRTDNRYMSYVRLNFGNTGGSFLEYSIYAAIIDEEGRQYNLVRTSEMGDLSKGMLLPGARREGFLLFEPVARESKKHRLIIMYRNYTYEFHLT